MSAYSVLKMHCWWEMAKLLRVNRRRPVVRTRLEDSAIDRQFSLQTSERTAETAVLSTLFQ